MSETSFRGGGCGGCGHQQHFGNPRIVRENKENQDMECQPNKIARKRLKQLLSRVKESKRGSVFDTYKNLRAEESGQKHPFLQSSPPASSQASLNKAFIESQDSGIFNLNASNGVENTSFFGGTDHPHKIPGSSRSCSDLKNNKDSSAYEKVARKYN